MVKKKSKFRHISIGRKSIILYKIVWYDILADGSHASANEFDNMKPALMTTMGYIYKKNKKCFGHLLVMMKKLLVIVMSFQ